MKITDTNNPHSILILDSLGGEHSDVQMLLSNYLKAEAMSKNESLSTLEPYAEDVKVSIDLALMSCTHPPCQGVPHQTNSYDCALYLIHFADMFLSRPSLYLKLIKVHSTD
jgi:Ulp1 family protease